MEKNEYEIQHFRFSAAQVSLERKHMLQKVIKKMVDMVVEELSSGNNNSHTAVLLAKVKSEVCRRMQKDLGELLPAMEKLDSQNFSIPEHVLLPTDFEHAKHYTKQDEDRIDVELQRLKQQFLENSIMIESLNAENDQYESIRTFICDEQKTHQQLQDSFTSIDLKKLEALVEKIKHLSNAFDL